MRLQNMFARSVASRLMAAFPIAPLQGSLRAEKCVFTHNSKRPEPSLTPEHCAWMSDRQASRTAAILTSAVLHGSWNFSKCALVHSASRFPSKLAALQNTLTSRLHAMMVATYWLDAEETGSITNAAKNKKNLATRPPKCVASRWRVTSCL